MKKINNKGAALFFVLGMLLIVVLMANIVLLIMQNQAGLTRHKVERIRQYYAAQAAIALALQNLSDGTWSLNTRYCINCTSGGTPATNRITDTSFGPLVIEIDIGNIGDAPPGPTGAPTIATSAPIDIQVQSTGGVITY